MKPLDPSTPDKALDESRKEPVNSPPSDVRKAVMLAAIGIVLWGLMAVGVFLLVRLFV